MIQTNIKSEASQNFVPIKEIRDGVIILKDNSLRTILMVSSLNFALKSDEEQEAIILQYQNFLNSLDFSIQFFIQSKGLNIEPYLETLEKKEQEQTDELLKIQTREYIKFVREFVLTTKIVNKTFYAVVPYTPAVLKERNGPIMNIIGKIFKKEQKIQTASQEKFEERKLQLQQRIDTTIQGLLRTGVRAAPLNTEELIELFYGLYNPDEAEKAKIPKYEP